MSEIEELLFDYAVGADATRHIWFFGGWPEHIGVTDQLLDTARPDFVTHGDGMVRFITETGTALYGYAHSDEAPGANHYDLISASRVEGEPPTA